MAFINREGLSISYECSALIEELKEDIREFGGDTIIAVWMKKTNGVEVITNYDFIVDDIKKEELLEGEELRRMTMTAALMYMTKQNEIF